MTPVTENEMILAFVQAESTSPRFARFLKNCDKNLILQPDLTNVSENKKRKELLGKYRGYGKDKFLFKGFPKKVEWFRTTLYPKDLKQLRYINHPQPNKLSGKTRLVSAALLNLPHIHVPGFSDNIFDTMKAINQGMIFPDIIIAGDVIVEGTTRATALAWANKITSAIVGKGNFKSWENRRI